MDPHRFVAVTQPVAPAFRGPACAEENRLAMSDTEVFTLAVEAAGALTGPDPIAESEGDYHGFPGDGERSLAGPASGRRSRPVFRRSAGGSR